MQGELATQSLDGRAELFDAALQVLPRTLADTNIPCDCTRLERKHSYRAAAEVLECAAVRHANTMNCPVRRS